MHLFNFIGNFCIFTLAHMSRTTPRSLIALPIGMIRISEGDITPPPQVSPLAAVGVSRVSSKYSGYDSAPVRLQGGSNKSPLHPLAVRLRMDNTSAVAYVNRLGGPTPSFNPTCL